MSAEQNNGQPAAGTLEPQQEAPAPKGPVSPCGDVPRSVASPTGDTLGVPTRGPRADRRIRSVSSSRDNRPGSGLPGMPQSDSAGSFNSAFSAVTDAALCSMIQFGVTSEQGSRRTMEDQHITLCGQRTAEEAAGVPNAEGMPFFGVYDGHGGTQCADYLRQNLHKFIFAHEALRTEPERAIKESILKAESEFMEVCKAERFESGSTCALALINDGVLVTANVGDSEIVLSRGGEPVLLTTKHHLAANPDEVERVKSCGGRIFHNRVGHPKFNPQLVSLGVSRAIGDAGFKLEEYTDGRASGIIADADTHTTKLEPADEFLVIACDGLFDVMTYADCVTLCRGHVLRGATCQGISEALVSEALRRGSTDNVTVLFVSLFPPTAPAAAPGDLPGDMQGEGSAEVQDSVVTETPKEQ